MADGRIDEREHVRMNDSEVLAFLRDCHTMCLSTLNRDATIHSVALWYAFLGDHIAFSTRQKSQKARNLARNPTVTCLFENGSHAYDQLKGVQIVGTARIVEDPSERFEIMRSAYDRNVRKYTDSDRPAVERMERGLFIAVVQPSRRTSWDHTKLPPRGQAR